MDALTQHSINFLKSISMTAPRLWVAFSGGLDSRVLLDLIVKNRQYYVGKIIAVHVNHGIETLSSEWVLFCQKIANTYDIEFVSEKILIKPTTDIENQLRDARYAIFKKLIQKNDILVTAHHQDDQAETLLLQLFRGAGIKGLSAMPIEKKLGEGKCLRPLLSFPRKILLAYAKREDLNWIEDPSNQKIAYTRNFFRQTIFSHLKNRWPNVSSTLSRVASQCSEQDKLLSSYLVLDLQHCAGSYPNSLSIKKLIKFEEVRRKYILRQWIISKHFILPSAKKLNEISRSILTAKKDRQPYLTWKNVEIRRYRDDLFIIKKLKQYHFNLQKIIQTHEVGLTIRFRQGGEKIRFIGKKHRVSLKKFFQQKKIPPWLRDRIPLIYQGNELIDVLVFC